MILLDDARTIFFMCGQAKKKHQNSPTKSSEVSVAREVTKSHLPAWKIRRFEHLKKFEKKNVLKQKNVYIIFLKETNVRMSKNQKGKKHHIAWRCFFILRIVPWDWSPWKPRYVSKSIKQSQIYEGKTKKNIIWWNKKSSLPLWNLVFVGSDLFEVHWLIPVSIGAAGLLGGFQRSPINPKGGNRWKWGWL